MASNLFARKPIGLILQEMEGEHRLRRVLGPVSLTALGVGCAIGAGIFVVTGQVASQTTGPAIILSFVVAGIACIFAGLCYAEFASMVPVAGSAYTYAYATLGEILAWIIGWDLILEYAVGAASVANGWSSYFQNLIGMGGLKVPALLAQAPVTNDPKTGALALTGTWMDLPAILLAVAVTLILVKGIRESAGANALMVMLKVAVVLMVIAVGAFFVDRHNWHPFAPFGYGGISFFGLGGATPGKLPVGMLAGAAIMFFAYIGFDSVSTHAEEARNPKRDVPIGIIGSLLVCTVLYIGVSAVLTGMVPYGSIAPQAPVAAAFQQRGLPGAQFIIGLAAVAGLTSVVLVLMLSQPRIWLAMARDGLVPKGFFGAVHPRFRTPWKATILTGCFVALLAGFLPLKILLDLVNIGTLFAFAVVCAGVLVMRYTHPEAPRVFRAPLVPLVPVLGILFCLMLMFSLPEANWYRLLGWLVIGLVIYFGYGRRRSVMARMEQQVAAAPPLTARE